jgi:hypothetical protein
MPVLTARHLAPQARRHCDRAAVVTAAILQIVETAPADQRREAIEDYLRDELATEPRDRAD